jgi:hypothetical protein
VQVRITKEELWTTALLARSYGAQGISAFNFIYTRKYYDLPCEFKINQPYSEPLFAELGMTKNATFLTCCADQYYRLDGGWTASVDPATVQVSMVRPDGGWKCSGRLRLLGSAALPTSVQVEVTLNGHVLEPTTNSTPFYDEGVQPSGGAFPADQWLAWVVPPVAVSAVNNTLTITLGQSGKGGAPVSRGPVNNTDLQPAATYLHTYKVYPNKQAGALACQAECDGDVRCAAWSYVIGHAGTAPRPGVERCCRHAVLGCPVSSAGVMSGAKTAGQCNNTSITFRQLQLAMPVGSATCAEA